MTIPTTKEELEMLLSSIHDECTPKEGHCDLEPIMSLLKSSQEARELCMILAMPTPGAHPALNIMLAICHGIKIGYQIRNPETVTVKV